MHETWEQIIGRHEPVAGRVEQFHAVTSSFHSFANSAQTVASEFCRLQHGYSSDKFAGEAATAFQEKVKEISHVVDDLPSVLRGIEGTFRHHAMELEVLRNRADEALARGRVHWREACDARASRDEADHRRRQLLSQVEYLEKTAVGSPSDDYEIEAVRDRADDARFAKKAAQHRLASAENALGGIVSEWGRLHDAEHALDKSTRARLEHQELWDLGDPSSIEQLAKALADFAKDLWEFGIDVLDLIPDEFLWALHGFLDALTTVLGVISLLALFVPFLQPVAAALAGVALIVGGLKLLVGGILYLKGSVNPDTGKPISGWELLRDGVFLAVGATAHALNGMKISDIARATNIIHPIRHVFIVDKAFDMVGYVETVVKVGGFVEDASNPASGSTAIDRQAAGCEGSSWNRSVSGGSARLVPVGAW